MPHPPIRPLGLPRGSIRALLALVVVAVACQQMLSGATPSLLLSETLMIVLTHYFTTRRHVEVAGELRERLVLEGLWPAQEKPLWLPRGTIRLAILGAFGLTTLSLIGQGRLADALGDPLLLRIEIVGRAGAALQGNAIAVKGEYGNAKNAKERQG